MLEIIRNSKIWFIVSGVIVAAGILATIIYGLNLGVDFKGGSLSEVKFAAASPSAQDIITALSEKGITAVSVQRSEAGTFYI